MKNKINTAETISDIAPTITKSPPRISTNIERSTNIGGTPNCFINPLNWELAFLLALATPCGISEIPYSILNINRPIEARVGSMLVSSGKLLYLVKLI